MKDKIQHDIEFAGDFLEVAESNATLIDYTREGMNEEYNYGALNAVRNNLMAARADIDKALALIDSLGM